MINASVRVLLDTVTFLWMSIGSDKLSRTSIQVLEDPGFELLLSTASTWEIAVKYSLGKLPLPRAPAEFVPHLRKQHDVASLAIGEAAALAVASLPKHHQDPFDRMLVAQALTHDLTILTPDRLVGKYSASTIW